MNTFAQTFRRNETVKQILEGTVLAAKFVVVAFALIGVFSMIYISYLGSIPEYQEAERLYHERCGSPAEYDAHGNKVPPRLMVEGGC